MTTPTGILFNEPINQPLSSNGVPQAGCYYCFFLTGTTTLANVYSNGTLSVALSQPTPGQVNPPSTGATVADSTGKFPAMYLNPGLIYRRQLYSAAGVLLSDVDPYVVYTTALAQTWTAAQTIAPASGIPLTLTAPSGSQALLATGAAGSYVAELDGSVTASQSFGLLIQAGTNSSDYTAELKSKSGTTFFRVRGDGMLLGYGATVGGLADMTPDFGSFTGALQGFTAGLNVTCSWVRNGKQVTLTICSNNSAAVGTSNSTSFSMTGLPAEIQPATMYAGGATNNGLEDNGAITNGTIGIVPGSGTVTFFKGTSSAAASWTASAAKGINSPITFSYGLQ